MKQPTKSRHLGLRVGPELAAKVDDFARILDRTPSDVLRMIIERAELGDLIPDAVKQIVTMEG